MLRLLPIPLRRAGYKFLGLSLPEELRELTLEEYLVKLTRCRRPWIKGGEVNPSPGPPKGWLRQQKGKF